MAKDYDPKKLGGKMPPTGKMWKSKPKKVGKKK
jgi:hypothetical protein